MLNLIELDASDDCGIDNIGLKCLFNLTSLDASRNEKITDINHLTNLKILFSLDDCGIGDDGIKLLKNLQFVSTNKKSKITTY